MSEHELYHYGRKGMKWGQHIFGKKTASAIRRTKKKLKVAMNNYKHKKAEKAAELEKKRPKKVSEMTDEELTNRLKRLRMEEEFRRLSPEPKKGTKDFIEGFVTKHGTDLANKIASKATQSIADAMFKTESPAKEKEISVLDMFNLNQYSDTEIANASKRMTNINNILKNWENNNTTYLRDFYGTDGYSAMVERGEGAVQEALRRMEQLNPSRS